MTSGHGHVGGFALRSTIWNWSVNTLGGSHIVNPTWSGSILVNVSCPRGVDPPAQDPSITVASQSFRHTTRDHTGSGMSGTGHARQRHQRDATHRFRPDIGFVSVEMRHRRSLGRSGRRVVRGRTLFDSGCVVPAARRCARSGFSGNSSAVYRAGHAELPRLRVRRGRSESPAGNGKSRRPLPKKGHCPIWASDKPGVNMRSITVGQSGWMRGGFIRDFAVAGTNGKPTGQGQLDFSDRNGPVQLRPSNVPPARRSASVIRVILRISVFQTRSLKSSSNVENGPCCHREGCRQ